MDAIKLTQELIRIKTVNPPGNEQECATYLGEFLETAGFDVTYEEFDVQRTSLIARIGGRGDAPPLCFTGHIDTVPLGSIPWSRDAFSAELVDGKLYGRGSSDMKSGLAAFVISAVSLAPFLRDSVGLVLVITAGEEIGCKGSKHLEAQKNLLGKAGAIVVGEPTANYPIIGHKGSVKFHAYIKGVTAHGSMPEKGVNAICKAVRAVTRLESFDFESNGHPVMGKPTLNIGTIHGGLNVNSVPDLVELGVDIRTVSGIDQGLLLDRIKQLLGPDVELVAYQNEAAVWTDPKNAWIQDLYDLLEPILGQRPRAKTVSYFTDAASLRRAFNFPPTVILGPGEPGMAHQTDEFCYIAKIEEAVEIYTKIIRRWCRI